jgi:hypothetical protein
LQALPVYRVIFLGLNPKDGLNFSVLALSGRGRKLESGMDLASTGHVLGMILVASIDCIQRKTYPRS